ncbi:MAG TPA: hypothetical protein VG818_06685, partial [Gemmatimonadaceae bacterium]|nr:hypothetical protein [Gemmatimonadaceae bacterium]
RPPSHDAPGWASAHAPRTNAALAQCATCHARESCARCHPNASQLRAITQLESDTRVAQLVRDLAPAYPTPASHRADGWPLDHGRDAQRAAATCANCHTQQGCKSCHIGSLGAQAIQALPLPAAGAPAGIVLRAPAQGMRPPGPAAIGPETTYTAAVPPADTMRARTVRVHPPGFATNHKEAAASGRLNCLGCHQQRQCTTCHDGVSVSRAYHPPDFMSRHATDAYSQQRDCSSCHRVETFCRSCHRSQGTPNTSSVRGSAHTAQPLWLLQHGQAARQGLTGCTSCHQQRDCLQCHSQLGRNINPHGPAFDAQAMGSRNKQVCLVCHVTDPLRK